MVEGQVTHRTRQTIGSGEMYGVDEAQPVASTQIGGVAEAAAVERHNVKGIPVDAGHSPQLVVLKRCHREPMQHHQYLGAG